MASSLLNSAVISKEGLRQFHNALVIGNLIDWSKSKEFGKGDNQIGNSIRIKREIVSMTQDNNLSWSSAVANGITSTAQYSVYLVIDSTKTAALTLTDADMTLKLEDFSKSMIKPRTKRLANRVDLSISAAVVNAAVGTTDFGGTDQFGSAGIANVGGYAGYTTGTFGAGIVPNDVLTAKRVMIEVGADEADGLVGVLSPYAQQTLLQANATLFNTYVQDGTEYKNGAIGSYAGIDWVTTQSLSVHTNGALSAVTPTTGELVPTSASPSPLEPQWQESSRITVPSMGSTLPNPGDVFVVPGVYKVNLGNGNPTTVPFQVTVLQVFNATTLITSPIITSGPYQNATATCMGKTWTLVGAVGASGQESLLFTEDAIFGAFVELDVPRNGYDMAVQISDEDLSPVKMRLLRRYDDIGSSQPGQSGAPAWITRIDLAYGIKVVNPDKIVRIRA